MFSGKTSRIIDVYEKAKLGNIETFVINHSDDTRYHVNMLSTIMENKFLVLNVTF